LRSGLKIPRSAHRMYLCVLCGSHNKQRLFPYTSLTDWFWQPRFNPLKPSGHYMHHQFSIKNSTFCPHSLLMCSVWISEQTATISLYINWPVFITETEGVYCAVRSGFQIEFRLIFRTNPTSRASGHCLGTLRTEYFVFPYNNNRFLGLTLPPPRARVLLVFSFSRLR